MNFSVSFFQIDLSQPYFAWVKSSIKVLFNLGNFKSLLLSICCLCSVVAIYAQNQPSVSLRGSINGFGNNLATYRASLSESWIVTIQATSDNATSGFLFANNNSFAPKWARGASVSFNTKTTWFANGADGTYNQVNGRFYTFIFRDVANGTNTEGYVFETSASPISVSTVTQSPLSSNVFPGNPVTVTATTSANLPTGQGVFLRYTNDNFTTSTILNMTGSGSSYVANIPASINTPSATIRYYVFTSGGTTPPSATDADLSTINLNNNSGANYSYTVAGGWTTANDGNWSVASTWTANAVPPASQSMGAVTIAHNVTFNQNATASSITINSGRTLTASANTLTINNNTSGTTFAVNGTYAASASNTVVFSGSATHTVAGTVNFQNVNLTSDVNFGMASTILGTLTVTSTGSVNTNAPFYADNSTLLYDAGIVYTYNRFNEWQTGSASTDRGVPFNVQVNANTTLNMDANIANGRTCRGSLTINGNFTMGNMTADIVVGQNVNINAGGSLTLGGQSGTNVGDIELRGNWNHNGGTFDNKARAVRFTGSTNQTVNFSGEEIFGYLIVNKTIGNVVFNCNALIDGGNSGFPLILDNGNIDLNGNRLRFNLWKSPSTAHDISVSGGGTRQITSTIAGAVFAIENSDNNERVATVTSSGSTLLEFGANVIVTIGSTNGLANAGINFGNAITTINGTLRINPRGFVRTNPPTYAAGSLLQYNVAGNYRRSVEWSTASGPGYPFNVQTSATTNFIAGGNSNNNTPLNMAGSLTIDAGTIFDMQDQTATPLPDNENMLVPLTVGLDINIAGKLWASQLASGNIILGRSWIRTATAADAFLHNNRSVTFSTSRDGTLTAPGTGESFYELIINKPGTGTIGTNFVGYRITLNSPVVVTNIFTLTSGYFVSTSANLLTLNAAASSTGGAVETFVSGPMRKLGNTDFSFPVGKITNTGALEEFHYRPIAIRTLGTSADYTTEFFRANPYLQGPISAAATAAGLQLISYCEYWNLTRSTGTNAITVIPSWSTHTTWSSKCNAIDYVISTQPLRVVPFTGSSQWGDADFGQTAVETGNQPYIQTISWNGAVNYNKFVLGSRNWRLAPLPFKILDFHVKPKASQSNIQWVVNDESSVKLYVIERSIDGINFQAVLNTTSRNSSSTSSYQRYDENPANGWNYYRLKVIDQSGKIEYSVIQKVWFGGNIQITISPNPASSTLNVYLPDPAKVMGISIFNATGQRMREIRNVRNNEAVDVSAYPTGQYILRVISAEGVKAYPFVKQ